MFFYMQSTLKYFLYWLANALLATICTIHIASGGGTRWTRNGIIVHILKWIICVPICCKITSKPKINVFEIFFLLFASLLRSKIFQKNSNFSLWGKQYTGCSFPKLHFILTSAHCDMELIKNTIGKIQTSKV